MRQSEWLAFGYFLWVAGAGCVGTRPLVRRVRIALAGVSMALVTLVVARLAPTALRDWAPGPYVLIGYFLSGWLFTTPWVAMEQWLAAWDARLLGDPTTRFARWPRWFLAYLELAYMSCFLVIPLGFLILQLTGHGDLADRYWTMVVAADFGAFAPLAFVQTRPPWALQPGVRLRDEGVHRVATWFVRKGTIGANTFPSGHVAVSLAVAFSVMGALPWVGLGFLIVALSIAVACVVGRYHYVVDVFAGVALALVVWVAVASTM